MERDSIDFSKGSVGRIFVRMLWPTLIGMISLVILNLTDGAFVGHGVGSDALAAINIVGPCFLLPGGIALMFGMGASVVASIHLSRGKTKAANINITQALIGAELITCILSALLLTFPETSCRLFGSSEQLLPLATKYMFWIALFQPLGTIASVGMFLIRLDGNPKLAMILTSAASISNMFFDWLLIFPFGMGIEGAAIATSCSFGAGGILTLVYLLKYSKTLHLYRLKMSVKSFLLTMRNIGYQMRLGCSAFFGDAAIAFVMIIGNYVYMRYLGEDGVAAFSIACYCFPVVFNVGNAIVVSAQPIISFAYGVGNSERVGLALKLGLLTAIGVGLAGILLMSIGSPLVASLFLDAECNAYHIAIDGLPIFGVGFLFIAINLMMVGYMQSIKRARDAAFYTFMRGYVLVLLAFVVMPSIWGVSGIWAAMPSAEFVTTMLLLVHHFVFGRRRRHNNARILSN